MKLLELPRKNSLFERVLQAVVVFSPLVVAVHFFYRQGLRAYPPHSDSIGIPIFTYFIFCYPLFLAIAMRGQKGLEQETRYFFWNPRRNWTSFLWTLAACYPALFLIFLLADAAAGMVIPSLLYFLLLGVALLVYRAGGISKKGKEKGEAGAPSAS